MRLSLGALGMIVLTLLFLAVLPQMNWHNRGYEPASVLGMLIVLLVGLMLVGLL